MTKRMDTTVAMMTMSTLEVAAAAVALRVSVLLVKSMTEKGEGQLMKSAGLSWINLRHE